MLLYSRMLFRDKLEGYETLWPQLRNWQGSKDYMKTKAFFLTKPYQWMQIILNFSSCSRFWFVFIATVVSWLAQIPLSSCVFFFFSILCLYRLSELAIFSRVFVKVKFILVQLADTVNLQQNSTYSLNVCASLVVRWSAFLQRVWVMSSSIIIGEQLPFRKCKQSMR